MKLAEEVEKYFDLLWPICRSITGNGLRESFHILEEIIPLELHEVPSGTKVLDWEIPREWNIEEAYIADESGNKIIDFKNNNLHVVNYSIPVDKIVSYEELLPHLYYKKELPDAIPYVTSYYKEKWGFCLSYNQFLLLNKSVNYRVVVKSTLGSGSLTYGELVLKGKSQKEILFTTYLCHPSMANNELSGPLTLAFLYRELSKRKDLNYSYRFVLAPETIGAIAYLDKNGHYLKESLLAGYVLTCCGDKGSISYKHSRKSDSLADNWFKRTAKLHDSKVKYYDFDPIGSDERQYCSPGYNLPVGSFMRTKYHEFKEYHTSLDNKFYISFEALEENILFLNSLIDTIEGSKIYIRTNPYGEPNMGRRGLYDDLSNKQNMPELLTMRMRLLNYFDGKSDLVTFMEKYNYSAEETFPEIKKLLQAGLIAELI